MFRESGGITDTEFRDKLWAAKDRRHLTIDEMCRMTKASHAVVERWLSGLSTPYSQVARDTVIRAVE